MKVHVNGHDMFKMLLEYMGRGENFRHTSHILFEAIGIEEYKDNERTVDIINLCENNVEKNVPRWSKQLGLSNKCYLVEAIKSVVSKRNLSYNEKYALIPKSLCGAVEREAASKQQLDLC